MDSDAKKAVLRMIPYGLYVLTADDGAGNVAAATVNWVTQTAFAPPLVVTNPADLGGVVIHQMIHVLAFFSQFVVPPAFVIGANVSYFKRSRSIRLFTETRTAGASASRAVT